MTASTSVHPRVRARRVALKRTAGRKRLRRLTALLAVVGCAIGIFLVTRSSLLDVDVVQAVGSDRVSAEDLIAAAAIDLSTPMTDVDLGAAEERIKGLPWVLDATVRKDWPNAVVIDDVVERTGVASVSVPGAKFALVDATAMVLDVSSSSQDVPQIVTRVAVGEPGERVEQLQPALLAAEVITPDLGAWVDSIVLGDDGIVDLVLVGGVTVLLGNRTDYSEQMAALAAILAGVELACLDTIDVQIHTRPVLTRQDHCT